MQLRVDNLTVHYGSSLAVSDVTFEVEQGSVVSIIGSNGAGKSTIMQAVSGLIPITSGETWFEDRRIDRVPAHEIVRLGLVQVPEGRRLFPYMTVLSNLRLGAYLRKDKAAVDESLRNVFKIFPRLKDRVSQKAGTLSGGEQQMLAVARGLMARPKMLLLDEPSIGLSPVMVEAIAQAIKDINGSGISILLVEQNAGLVTEVTEKAYVLEVGSVVSHGKISDLMSDRQVHRAFLGV